MEEDFLFKCEICGSEFPADPECMVSISSNSYLVGKTNLYLEWEGSHSLNSGDIPDSLYIEQIICPSELSNNAICICRKCQDSSNLD